jgi:hypothetical protein
MPGTLAFSLASGSRTSAKAEEIVRLFENGSKNWPPIQR